MRFQERQVQVSFRLYMLVYFFTVRAVVNIIRVYIRTRTLCVYMFFIFL
jgi:hypothetical protein